MIRLCRCLDCDLLFTVLQSEDPSVPPVEADEVNAEWLAHKEHRLDFLEVVKGTTFSRDVYDLPDRVVYFTVSNGREQFLAVKKRLGLVGGYRYELHRGCIIPMPPVLSAQEEDLQRQIIRERHGDLPDTDDIAAFIRILREGVARLVPAQLVDEVADSGHPLVSYAKAPRTFFFEVMARGRTALSSEASGWFSDFINRHQDDLVPLGIRVVRDFEVVSEFPSVAGASRTRHIVSSVSDKSQSGTGSRGV